MELYLLANAVGKSRRTTVNGREYVVAPLTLIVPGVLNGSKGALYYPEAEVKSNPGKWDNVPLVVYHPTQNGAPVSARAPGIIEKSGIGWTKKSVFNGKLQSEGWFDLEKTKAVDKRVYNALLAGKQIELSTGLFTDNEKAPLGSNFKGKGYSFIAKNYRPDHIAILPDQVGACSVNDGCGVMVNKKADGGKCPECGAPMAGGECSECDYVANKGGGFFQKLARYLLLSGFTSNQPRHPKDGTYQGKAKNAAAKGFGTTAEPSTEAEPLADEDAKIGQGDRPQEPRSKEDDISVGEDSEEVAVDNELGHSETHSKLQQKLRSQYKQDEPSPWISEVYNDHMIYDHGQKTYKHEYTTDEAGAVKLGKKSEVRRQVSYVPVGNSTPKPLAFEVDSTSNSAEDPDMAVKFTPEQKKQHVDFLIANCDCWKGKDDDKVLNTFPDEKLQKLVAQTQFVANAKAEGSNADVTADGKTAAQLKKKKAVETGDNDLADGADVESSAAVTGNRKTVQQWLSEAPPEVQEQFHFSQQITNQQKSLIANRLVAHIPQQHRKAEYDNLMKKPLPALMEMAKYMSPVANQQQPTAPVPQQQVPNYNYLGMGGPAGGYNDPAQVRNRQDDDADDLLDLPTINFAEEARKARTG